MLEFINVTMFLNLDRIVKVTVFLEWSSACTKYTCIGARCVCPGMRIEGKLLYLGVYFLKTMNIKPFPFKQEMALFSTVTSIFLSSSSFEVRLQLLCCCPITLIVSGLAGGNDCLWETLKLNGTGTQHWKLRWQFVSSQERREGWLVCFIADSGSPVWQLFNTSPRGRGQDEKRKWVQSLILLLKRRNNIEKGAGLRFWLWVMTQLKDCFPWGSDRGRHFERKKLRR